MSLEEINISPSRFPGAVPTWTPEKTQEFIELWNAGKMSMNDIAGKLGVTRSAIAGKRNRLGLKMRLYPDFVCKPYIRSQQPKRERRERTISVPRAIRRMKHKEKPPAIPTLPEPSAEFRCDLIARRNDQCCFIYGHVPDHEYCGHPKWSGQNYCGFHHRLMRRPK